jgi:hypothetical protein
MSRVKMIWVVVIASLPISAVRAIDPQPADPTILRLSDAEKADLLSHGTEASVDAARAGPGGPAGPARAIHGEVGALVGSHGTRAAYGTAAIPLGANGRAIVSFESSRSERPY